MDHPGAIEMVVRDLQEQGVPEAEIADVVRRLTEDQNMRQYLASTKKGEYHG